MSRKKNGYNQSTGLYDVTLQLKAKPCWTDKDCFIIFIDGKPYHIYKGLNCGFVNALLKMRDKKIKDKYRAAAKKGDDKR